MKQSLFAALVAVAALNGAPAVADCASHNPLDTRCNPADFSGPIGTVRWYLNNRFDRQTTLTECRGPFPPPRAWCEAAMQANKLTTGTAQGAR
jgi:hypothetical protein